MRHGASALYALLADDFHKFAASGGAWESAQVIAARSREPVAERTLSDLNGCELAPGVVLVTYLSSQGTCRPRCATRSEARVPGSRGNRFRPTGGPASDCGPRGGRHELSGHDAGLPRHAVWVSQRLGGELHRDPARVTAFQYGAPAAAAQAACGWIAKPPTLSMAMRLSVGFACYDYAHNNSPDSPSYPSY
ncbi:hypothetical protein [Pseudomonas typographi]|uniref:hypothetical protein n=1 Tax=Pseudomonas typographi TaxID=2715964 RepID=UPI0016885036|nr:hypothetical protein [Pseudomonas typographi]MBD1552833.1 hypothetical protein [Pseudomonas typographi]